MSNSKNSDETAPERGARMMKPGVSGLISRPGKTL